MNASDRLFLRMLTQPQDVKRLAQAVLARICVNKFFVGFRVSTVVLAIRRILCMPSWNRMKLPSCRYPAAHGRPPVPWKDNWMTVASFIVF